MVVTLPTEICVFISFVVTGPGLDQCKLAAGKFSLLQSGLWPLHAKFPRPDLLLLFVSLVSRKNPS